MSTLKNLDDALAAKFLAGEASPEEAIQVNEWIESSNENKMHFKELESIWGLQGKKHHHTPSKSGAWHSLQSSLTKTKKISFSVPYRIAATILFIILTGAGIYFLRSSSSSPEEEWNVKQTNSEVASLTLSDGTSVTMNRKSKLLWPKQYASTTREVRLDGEAFFDVVHNPLKPFIISTDDIQIKVLGTSFNVWDDRIHNEIKTDVTRGKVMMYTSTKNIIVEAGMIGIYHKQTKEFTLLKMPDQNAIGYATHSLTFTNSTLDEVCKQLSKTYGVQFVFENNQLLDCRLTTEYENKSLSFILNVIEESLSIKYRIKNDTVHISGNGCL